MMNDGKIGNDTKRTADLDKTKVVASSAAHRQYITKTRKRVDHALLKKLAQTEPYQLETELARGAESVLYTGQLKGHEVCIKAVRGFLNKIIGDSITRRQEEKLEKVSFKTKERHIVNEYEVSKIVCADDDEMPLVHIYALRKVKKLGVELGYDLIMEYLNGHDLADKSLIKSLTVEERMDVFVQAVQALNYFHSKKLIHLDIKPSNFILSKGKVKLLDFGVSVSNGYRPTAITGTGGYLSPEQICKAPLNYATDIFALGVAFAVLFGAKPLNQPQSSLVQKQFRADAQHNLERDTMPCIGDLPDLEEYPGMADIIRSCTIAKRELRCSSCQGLLSRIREWAQENNVDLPSLKQD